MKKYILIIPLIFAVLNCFAQNDETESSKPSYDTEIVRRCAGIVIEGEDFFNVIVTLKSISPDHFLSDKHKVKVLVKDENGKKIYKKTFSNAYLYIFSNGQIQVGKPKFNQIVIRKGIFDERLWFGEIREKEGVWY